MGLFGNYENAGVGIAKNAPKKKPFFRFWELVGRKFWKLIELNMLFMTCLLPIIGAILVIYFCINVNEMLTLFLAGLLVLISAVIFGPYIAGCTKILRNFTLEKPMFFMDTFWKTFKGCFKQSCIMGLLDIIVAGSVAAGFYVYPQLISYYTDNGGSPTMYYILFVASLSIALAILLFGLFFTKPQKLPLMPVYCTVYGVWRFLIEYARADDRGATVISAVTPSQLIAILMILFGVCYLAIFFFNRKQKRTDTSAVEK